MAALLWFVSIGLAAGLLAGRFVKGNGGFGVAGDIVAGVVGALFGGFLFITLDASAVAGLFGSLIVATIGAVIFLMVLRQFKRA